MSLQKYFKDFNDAIRLDFDVNSELSEKRDILLKKLKNSEKLPSKTFVIVSIHILTVLNDTR